MICTPGIAFVLVDAERSVAIRDTAHGPSESLPVGRCVPKCLNAQGHPPRRVAMEQPLFDEAGPPPVLNEDNDTRGRCRGVQQAPVWHRTSGICWIELPSWLRNFAAVAPAGCQACEDFRRQRRERTQGAQSLRAVWVTEGKRALHENA